jgi:hypothetical protein
MLFDMRFLRFSIKRLFLLTTVVAVVLYLFYLRPSVVARQFAQEIDAATQSHVKEIGQEYFDSLNADGRVVEVNLYPRSWSDILMCRQAFSISIAVSAQPEGKTVCTRLYRSTAFGVEDVGKPVLEPWKPAG